jgi:hypothetical protein
LELCRESQILKAGFSVGRVPVDVGAQSSGEWLLVPISSPLPTVILEILTDFACFILFLRLLLVAGQLAPSSNDVGSGASTFFLCDFSSVVTSFFAPLHRVFLYYSSLPDRAQLSWRLQLPKTLRD